MLVTRTGGGSFSDRASRIEKAYAQKRNDLQKSFLVTDCEQTRRMVDLTATTWEEHAHDRGTWWPLTIPTYDGDPSVGHPSVVFAPKAGMDIATRWRSPHSRTIQGKTRRSS
jgi:hypothetical protein